MIRKWRKSEQVPLNKPRWEKLIDNQVLLQREHIRSGHSDMSSYFPIGGLSVTRNKLKGHLLGSGCSHRSKYIKRR